MFWVPAKDGDPLGFNLYERHYSRKNKKPKQRQFVGPGGKLVLIGFMCRAVFAWRKFIDHSGHGGGVCCTLFRNESEHQSSDMIREAMGIAWERWPGERLYTMVDPVATAGRRGRKNPPGQCFVMAGWRECGRTQKGLIVLETLP